MVTMAANPAAMACLYQMIIWPFWHHCASLPYRNDETPSIFFLKATIKRMPLNWMKRSFFAVVFFKHLVDFLCVQPIPIHREKRAHYKVNNNSNMVFKFMVYYIRDVGCVLRQQCRVPTSGKWMPFLSQHCKKLENFHKQPDITIKSTLLKAMSDGFQFYLIK